MENQTRPAFENGAKSGSTPLVLSPPVQPPPCTRMTAGRGPFPSGTQASKRRLSPPARPYSKSFLMPLLAAQLFRDAFAFLKAAGWAKFAVPEILCFGFQPSVPRRTLSGVMLRASAAVNCFDHG